MRQKCLNSSIFLLIVAFLFLFSQQAFAEELKGTSRQEVLIDVQDAFNAQVSLTEKTRTFEEIKKILSSYFEDELTELYIEKNVQKEDGKYIVYGTDFPLHTVPFFSYNENTKVFEQGNDRIIYEFFPASTDGPVEYNDYYEVLKMHKTEDGWKIYSIQSQAKVPKLIDQQGKNGIQQNVKSEGEQKIVSGDKQQQKSTASKSLAFSNVKQPIMEINEVLFFNSFYFQLNNLINEKD